MQTSPHAGRLRASMTLSLHVSMLDALNLTLPYFGLISDKEPVGKAGQLLARARATHRRERDASKMAGIVRGRSLKSHALAHGMMRLGFYRTTAPSAEHPLTND